MADGKRKAATAGTRSTAKNTRRPAARKPASKPGAKPAKPPKTPKTWKQRLLWFAKWGTAAALILALIAMGLFFVAYQSIDIPDPNEDFLTETTHVYYADGKTDLGQFAVQKRDAIGLDEMPDTLKDAVVAAENQSFWTDEGIDPKGILRAAFSNARGNVTQGASTITQQYVKILYLSQERSWKRKVKEAILSLKVENQVTKEEVLEGYLNTIYFGRGAYGVQAAAGAYFDKEAKDLSLRESAVLASLLNDPNDLDPANGRDSKQALKERYDYVLGEMADIGAVDAADAERAAKRLPAFPEVEQEDSYGGQKGHLLQMVKQELLRLGFSEQEINGGGLQVTTTFTEKAMDAAKEGMLQARPDGFGYKELHVGVATVEPGTGAVRGIYGGQDYLESQLNWAVAGGQAGSTFKPFALAAGIKDGFSIEDTFDGNSPYLFPNGDDVENQGDSDYGTVSMITATENSVNTAYIDMTMSMDNGPQKIVDTAVDMGIPPAEPPSDPWGFPTSSGGLQPNAGVSLGSQTVSPINMANGYATIANGGVAAEPFIIEKVVDGDGKERYNHKVVDHRAISEDIAADVSYAMQQVVESGSGAEAMSGFAWPAAGKTGTATKTGGAVSSAWFAGFTAQYSTAVVYLRGNGTGQLDGWLPEFYGGTYPAQTFRGVMDRVMEGEEPIPFPEPAFVDGDAPEEGHEPYTPPPPSPTRTKKDEPEEPETTEPSEPETTEPSEPETTEPTESETTPEEPDPEPDSDGDGVPDADDNCPFNPDPQCDLSGGGGVGDNGGRDDGRLAATSERRRAGRRTPRG